MQAQQPRGRRAVAERPGGEQQAPHDRGQDQRPGHEATRPGDVPGDLGVHGVSSPWCGVQRRLRGACPRPRPRSVGRSWPTLVADVEVVGRPSRRCRARAAVVLLVLVVARCATVRWWPPMRRATAMRAAEARKVAATLSAAAASRARRGARAGACRRRAGRRVRLGVGGLGFLRARHDGDGTDGRGELGGERVRDCARSGKRPSRTGNRPKRSRNQPKRQLELASWATSARRLDSPKPLGRDVRGCRPAASRTTGRCEQVQARCRVPRLRRAVRHARPGVLRPGRDVLRSPVRRSDRSRSTSCRGSSPPPSGRSIETGVAPAGARARALPRRRVRAGRDHARRRRAPPARRHVEALPPRGRRRRARR